MALHVSDLAKGPALGDFVDRLANQRRTAYIVFAVLGLAFVVVSLVAPLVGLLLLATLILVGVAGLMYSRKRVHGHGRLAVHRGQRR